MREPRLGPAEPMPAALSATDMGNSAVTTDAGRDRLRSAEFASVQVQQPRWRVPSRCTSNWPAESMQAMPGAAGMGNGAEVTTADRGELRSAGIHSGKVQQQNGRFVHRGSSMADVDVEPAPYAS